MAFLMGSVLVANGLCSTDAPLWFQRRFLEIDQELPILAMFVTDRHKMSNLNRTFHRCFLPSFSSFSQAGFKGKDF
jgi:hypothetical protein